MVRITAIVAAGAVVLGLAACDEAAEKAAEEVAEQQGGGDVDIDLDDGEVRVEGENGEGSFSLGDDLPSDFPVDDVPLPEGGELVASASGTSSDGSGWNLTFSGLDAGDVGSYRDALAGDGYEIENSVTDESGDVSGFTATGNGYAVLAGGGPEGFNLTVTTA